MKIAVSTKGPSLNSAMDPRFGRTTGFVLFDTESGQSSYLDNVPRQGLAQGTGIQTARLVVDAGADVLITGQMGPNAFGVLNRAGIKVLVCSGGTVQGALQAMERNALCELSSDSLHPGPGKMGGRGMGGGGRGRGRGAL